MDTFPDEIIFNICENMSIHELRNFNLTSKSNSICSEILQNRLSKINKIIDDIVVRFNPNYGSIIFIVPNIRKDEDYFIFMGGINKYEGVLKLNNQSYITKTEKYDKTNLRKILKSIITAIINLGDNYIENTILYAVNNFKIRDYDLISGFFNDSENDMIEVEFRKPTLNIFFLYRKYAEKYVDNY